MQASNVFQALNAQSSHSTQGSSLASAAVAGSGGQSGGPGKQDFQPPGQPNGQVQPAGSTVKPQTDRPAIVQTYQIPSQAPPAPLTAGSYVLTPVENGVAVGSATLIPGGSAVLLSGVPISLNSNTRIQVGSDIYTIPAAQAAITTSLPNGQAAVVLPNAISLQGTIISAGGPAVTVSGSNVISLGSSRNLVYAQRPQSTGGAQAVGSANIGSLVMGGFGLGSGASRTSVAGAVSGATSAPSVAIGSSGPAQSTVANGTLPATFTGGAARTSHLFSGWLWPLTKPKCFASGTMDMMGLTVVPYLVAFSSMLLL